MEYFYRSKPFDEEGNMSEDPGKQCLENGDTENCLNQHSNVYVTKKGKLGKMNSFHNLNWKQLKEK